MRELFKKLGETLKNGEDAVLVTIVASSGSTPRGSGARMLITRKGRVCGTIGGGAVEYKSEHLAAEVLQRKSSEMELFRLYKNEVADLGMICGGDVTVYFRYIPPHDESVIALTEEIESLYERGEQSWLICDITEGSDGVMAVYGKKRGIYGAEIPAEVIETLESKPVQSETGGKKFYAEKLIQAGRVYIFGGGHVAQALVPALNSVGFICMVLEDRAEFLKPELFGGFAQTKQIDMEHILEAVDITADDYVCIMTRGHKDDYTVQRQVLKTPAYYIGVIGSKHKTAGVNAKLAAEGYGEADFARITTPIGLDIKAETPAEIAISITAQLIQVRAQRTKA